MMLLMELSFENLVSKYNYKLRQYSHRVLRSYLETPGLS